VLFYAEERRNKFGDPAEFVVAAEFYESETIEEQPASKKFCFDDYKYKPHKK
jgi:hypothetical protein